MIKSDDGYDETYETNQEEKKYAVDANDSTAFFGTGIGGPLFSADSYTRPSASKPPNMKPPGSAEDFSLNCNNQCGSCVWSMFCNKATKAAGIGGGFGVPRLR